MTWAPFFNQNESTSWKHLPQFMAMKTVHTISRDTKHHKFWDRKIGLFVRTKLFFYFFNPMWSQLMKVFHTYTDPEKLWDMLRKWLNQPGIVSSQIIDFTFIEHFSALCRKSKIGRSIKEEDWFQRWITCFAMIRFIPLQKLVLHYLSKLPFFGVLSYINILHYWETVANFLS